jgi:GNAT superfamily N-acetyltransferase
MASPAAGDRPAIRAAGPEDLGLILTYIRALAEYEHFEQNLTVGEALLREHLFGPAPRAWVLIAELGGRPVGFALYFWNFSTFLGRPGIYLEDLFVVPEARGKGAGRALLAALAREVVRAGGGRLEWSVLDWNEPSIAFYRRLGARAMDEWTTYRVTDEGLDRLAGEAG